jgi:hypothetical protein
LCHECHDLGDRDQQQFKHVKDISSHHAAGYLSSAAASSEAPTQPTQRAHEPRRRNPAAALEALRGHLQRDAAPAAASTAYIDIITSDVSVFADAGVATHCAAASAALKPRADEAAATLHVGPGRQDEVLAPGVDVALSRR